MMYEKRPTAAKGNRGLNVKTTIRRDDGSVWEFPISNPDPIQVAKALTRRKQRRSAARPDVDNTPRTAEDIRERMRRQLAARERKLGISKKSSVEQTYTTLPGGWTLDVQ